MVVVWLSETLKSGDYFKRAKQSMITRLIHIGCGKEASDGWENYDASPYVQLEQAPLIGRVIRTVWRPFPAQIRYGDILKGALCEKGTADGVYASHVLEHLSHSDARLALKHIAEMIKPGGVFRCVVPDLEWRSRRYIQDIEKGDPVAADRFIESLDIGHPNSRRGIRARIREAISNARHQWMYDERSLSKELTDAGFSSVRRCDFGDSGLAHFDAVESKERFINSKTGNKELAFHCQL